MKVIEDDYDNGNDDSGDNDDTHKIFCRKKGFLTKNDDDSA